MKREFHGMGSRSKCVDLATQKFYRTWSLMKDRCLNKKSQSYVEYGGRGITVSKEWLSFSSFYRDMYPSYLAHVLESGLGSGTTLERMNNEKGYSKNNCRWATMREQSNNRRSNRFLIFEGKKLSISQWSERTGINRRTITQRIEHGWPISQALTRTPSLKKGR